jgi:hypothetical protein
MLTLGQAAKEVGRSKTALTNAIRSGRLSAARLNNGSYSIDPAELFRVYSPVDTTVNSKPMHISTHYINPNGHIENELLRDLIEQVKSERDDLRKRLNDTEASRQRMELELQRLTLLLTHQSTPNKKTNILFNKIFKK